MRDKGDLAALRNARKRDVLLWRVALGTAAALLLLGLGELAMGGGAAWQKTRQRQFDVQKVSSHGGSLRVFIAKQKSLFQVQPIVGELLELEKDKGCLSSEVYEKFAARVLNFKKDLNVLVKKIRDEGKTIWGYGAPAKATTIINFCELTTSEIENIVDDNPLKQGRYVPGGPSLSASAPNGANGCIPIVSSSHLEAKTPDFILIFAWNFAKEIIGKIGHLQNRGVQFIVPLPEPRIVHDHDHALQK